MSDSSIDKYLASYAEPEAELAQGLFTHSTAPFRHCIAAPFYAEPDRHLRRLLHFTQQQYDTLLLIIINEPDSANAQEGVEHRTPCISSSEVQVDIIAEYFSPCSNNSHLQLYRQQSNAVLLVSRFRGELRIPHRQGVGLARKILADIALVLYRQKQLSTHWLHCTDADVSLPANYLPAPEHAETQCCQTPGNPRIAACVYPFKHLLPDSPEPHVESPEHQINSPEPHVENPERQINSPEPHIESPERQINSPEAHVENREPHIENPEPLIKSPEQTRLQAATRLYEKRLQRYCEGLAAAGSAYAYQTVGSAMAINLRCYGEVRGFPKRSGGEDFYLLNKLRKTGEIASLTEPCIHIESRISQRASFGTGVAVTELLGNEDLDDCNVFYHPKCFQLLAATLHWVESVFDKNTFKENTGADGNNFAWRTNLLRFSSQADKQAGDQIDSWYTIDHGEVELIEQALDSIGFESGLNHCLAYARDKDSFRFHMMCWFDSFRTLKFIHFLRALHYPDLNENNYLDCVRTCRLPIAAQ